MIYVVLTFNVKNKIVNMKTKSTYQFVIIIVITLLCYGCPPKEIVEPNITESSENEKTENQYNNRLFEGKIKFIKIGNLSDELKNRFTPSSLLDTNDTLRVLILSGKIIVSEILKLDEKKYYLNNPNSDVELSNPLDIKFCGYIIYADTLVFEQNIETDGHDIVFIANRIEITDSSNIIINTSQKILDKPNKPSKHGVLATNGVDSKNSGDILLISQEIKNPNNLKLITNGAKGQDAGDGADATIPPIIKIKHESEEQGPINFFGDVNINDIRFGTVVKIGEESNDCIYQNFWDGKDEYGWYKESEHLYSGEYGINGIVDSAVLINKFSVLIESQYYPTNGGSGGFGGLPGKLTFISQDTTPGHSINYSGLVGVSGNPGQPGKKMDVTPLDIELDLVKMPTDTFVSKYTIEKIGGAKSLDWHRNTFESKPKCILPQSLRYFTTYGQIRMSYFPSLNEIEKNRPITYDLNWGYVKTMWFSHYCNMSPGLISHDNYITFNKPNKLNLILRASTGSIIPKITGNNESIVLMNNNWYECVNEFLPEFYKYLYNIADNSYRVGLYETAKFYYNHLISLNNYCEIPAQNLIINTERFLLQGENNYDYFGFKDSVYSASSPSKYIEILDIYSDITQFYNSTLQNNDLYNLDLSSLKTYLDELIFKQNMAINELERLKERQSEEIEVLNIEVEAIKWEIDAIIRENFRYTNILNLWITIVNEKIKQLNENLEDCHGWECLPWNEITNGLNIAINIYKICTNIPSLLSSIFPFFDSYINLLDINSQLKEWESIRNDFSEEEYNEILKKLETDKSNIDKEYTKIASTLSKSMKETSTSVSEVFKNINTLNASTLSYGMDGKEFEENILNVESLGVSGGITYLDISSRIKTNDDILVVKKLTLTSLYNKIQTLLDERIKIAYEIKNYELNKSYLTDKRESLESEILNREELNELIVESGQTILDSYMKKVRELELNYQYLGLEDKIEDMRYNCYISDEISIGRILQRHLILKNRIDNWQSQNNTFGRLNVRIQKTDSNYLNRYQIIDSIGIQSFNDGKFTTNSYIVNIEPLILNSSLIQISTLLKQTTTNEQKVNILNSIFIDNNVYKDSLIFFINTPQSIVNRELLFTNDNIRNILLNLSPMDVIFLYTIISAELNTDEVNTLFSDPNLSLVLKSAITRFIDNWIVLQDCIKNELSYSLASEIFKFINCNTINERVEILNSLIAENNEFVGLNKFRITDKDIFKEMDLFLDQHDEKVLNSFYLNDSLKFITGIILLRAGVDYVQLENLISTPGLKPKIATILSELKNYWVEAKSKVLETEHKLFFNIEAEKLYDLPHQRDFRYCRFLQARVHGVGNDNIGVIGLKLTKLSNNYFRNTNDSLLLKLWPESSQIIYSNEIPAPLGFQIENYHTFPLFGRSLIGNWEVSIIQNGNITEFDKIEGLDLEFLFISQN